MTAATKWDSTDSAPERARKARNVLITVLAINMGIACIKLGYGNAMHIASVSADGVHSLFDSVANVVAILGTAIASKPADADHPYGHSKFATYASVFIGLVLTLAAITIGVGAINDLRTGQFSAQISVASFGVMLGTLAANLLVTTWEHNRAKVLQSDVLAADAKHTASDVAVTLGVLASLALVKLGLSIADPIMSLIVAAIILVAAMSVFRDASQTLSDTARIPAADVRACVESLPGVLGCHTVRTRGSESEIYVDLHMLVDGNMTVTDAHELADRVERRIQEVYPSVADVVVHIEPLDDKQRHVSQVEREKEDSHEKR
jgi:cation diffusion facilitator family transporter